MFFKALVLVIIPFFECVSYLVCECTLMILFLAALILFCYCFHYLFDSFTVLVTFFTVLVSFICNGECVLVSNCYLLGS